MSKNISVNGKNTKRGRRLTKGPGYRLMSGSKPERAFPATVLGWVKIGKDRVALVKVH